jgi:hypothetical protein
VAELFTVIFLNVIFFQVGVVLVTVPGVNVDGDAVGSFGYQLVIANGVDTFYIVTFE